MGSEFYLIYMEHKINCSVKSVPFPTSIDWFWQSCTSPVNCSIQSDMWEPVNITDSGPVVFPKLLNFMSEDKLTNISQLIVKENRVGFYKCRGRNKVGSISALIPFVATGMLRRNSFHHFVVYQVLKCFWLFQCVCWVKFTNFLIWKLFLSWIFLMTLTCFVREVALYMYLFAYINYVNCSFLLGCN